MKKYFFLINCLGIFLTNSTMSPLKKKIVIGGGLTAVFLSALAIKYCCDCNESKKSFYDFLSNACDSMKDTERFQESIPALKSSIALLKAAQSKANISLEQ